MGQQRRILDLFLPALLLVILATGLFLPVRNYAFVDWDDIDALVQNPYLKHPAAPSVAFFWTHPYQGLYTPLSYTFWSLLACLDGAAFPSPWLYHLGNVLLHAVSVLMVFAIARRLLGRTVAAFAAAALFAVHPLQVESVAWVAGMNNLLAGALALAALWQYLVYLTGRRPGAHYLAASLLFALALLAKPTAACLPLIAAFLAGLIGRCPWRRVLLSCLPWLVLSLGMLLITRLVQPAPEVFVPPLWARPLLVADSFTFYLSKLLLPARLAVDYGRTPQWLIRQTQFYVFWLIPLGLILAAWRCRLRWPWFLAAIGVFLAAILPVCGVVPTAFQRISLVADRYVYLAMLAPALLLGWALTRHATPLWMGCVALLLGLLAWQAHSQLACWQNTFTLFERNLQVNRDSPFAHYALAVAFARQGRVQASTEHYRDAVALQPDNAEIRYNWGNLLLRQGQFGEAIEQYQAACPQMAANVRLLVNLGTAYARSGRFPQAVQAYRRAVELAPDLPEARLALAAALRAIGENPGAVGHDQAVTTTQPLAQPQAP